MADQGKGTPPPLFLDQTAATCQGKQKSTEKPLVVDLGYVQTILDSLLCQREKYLL